MGVLRFLIDAIIGGLTACLIVSISATAIKDAYLDAIKQRIALMASASDKERLQNDISRKVALKNTAEVMNSIQISFVREFTKKADEYIAKINSASGGTIQ